MLGGNKMPIAVIDAGNIGIKGSLSRHEIVREVVNTFIDSESQHRGKGIKFRYFVENLSNNKKLFIFRPGGLNKWNFDFKVEVLEEFGLGRGTHKEIVADFKNKKQENPKKFIILLDAVENLYNCSENNVDRLMKKYHNLQASFKRGARVDVLLKILKWMFIMEDIVYWNYQGRSMLFNAIKGI